MSKTETTYNGWTNYETWNCKLWLGNDEGEHNYVQDLAKDAHANPIENRYMTLERRRVHSLADSLKAYMEEQAERWMPDQASFFADIFNAALGQVNWYEIAESYLEDVEDDDETDS